MWKLLLLIVLVVPPGAPEHDDHPHDRPIHQAQNEADRGTGRVVDQSTYEIGRMQHRHLRTAAELQADFDRQERLDRQRKSSTTGPAFPAERFGFPRPGPGAELTAKDIAGGERLELMADLLSALDEHDRQLIEAQRELAGDSHKLNRRKTELEDLFAQRLAGILGNYDLKRLPATRPAPTVQPTSRPSEHESNDPIRLPAPAPR
jgi:hypothetical protein